MTMPKDVKELCITLDGKPVFQGWAEHYEINTVQFDDRVIGMAGNLRLIAQLVPEPPPDMTPEQAFEAVTGTKLPIKDIERVTSGRDEIYVSRNFLAVLARVNAAQADDLHTYQLDQDASGVETLRRITRTTDVHCTSCWTLDRDRKSPVGTVYARPVPSSGYTDPVDPQEGNP